MLGATYRGYQREITRIRPFDLFYSLGVTAHKPADNEVTHNVKRVSDSLLKMLSLVGPDIN
jgi:hypothetical protein